MDSENEGVSARHFGSGMPEPAYAALQSLRSGVKSPQERYGSGSTAAEKRVHLLPDGWQLIWPGYFYFGFVGSELHENGTVALR
jgi:hypothetical protein